MLLNAKETDMTRKVAQAFLPVCLLVCLAATLIAAQRPPAPRHEVVGHIAGMAPGHHAVLRAAGRERHAATARADGTYVLRGLRPGSYTIRPSHPRYHFTPDFRSVAITNHDVGNVNFVAHLRPLPPRRR
jgi:hypothetical protein